MPISGVLLSRFTPCLDEMLPPDGTKASELSYSLTTDSLIELYHYLMANLCIAYRRNGTKRTLNSLSDTMLTIVLPRILISVIGVSNEF